MHSKLRLLSIVIVIATVGIFLTLNRTTQTVPPEKESGSQPPIDKAIAPPPVDLTPGLEPLEKSLLLQFSRGKNTSVHDLTILSQIWQTYSRKIESLPYGNESDWSRALLGSNRLKSAFFPADHRSINQNRQICDSWGTPLRYHVQARDQVEVISAGPDKKFYTPDDVKSRSHR